MTRIEMPVLGHECWTLNSVGYARLELNPKNLSKRGTILSDRVSSRSIILKPTRLHDSSESELPVEVGVQSNVAVNPVLLKLRTYNH